MATATLAKMNLDSLVPAIESRKEPSHGPSARPGRTCAENYSERVIKDYHKALRGYIKAEVELPPLEDKISLSARARNYFKDKEAGRVTDSRRKFSSLRNNSQQIAVAVQPQVFSYQVQGPS
ncbi:unnamed protein product [Nippostrongylus brasiliensis]|uniref:Reverse transcriptase domain-containing protein n=1 Tax=Nippostrongylus brasiliensis TaxID=27835 RepID=A0A0N4YIT2_NIPBR|nr:unnamed protein product [Nippostrongylus brasiliensis]